VIGQIHINRATDEIVNVTFIRAPPHALLKVDVPLLYRGADACPGIRKGIILVIWLYIFLLSFSSHSHAYSEG